MVKVYVRLLGDLREAMGKERLEIELPSGMRLREVIEAIPRRYDGLREYIIDSMTGEIRTDLIILVNEKSIESFAKDEEIKDNDIITLASAIAGG
ncbi:MAG: MoaD/ThiS family protein [archaeon]|nr:MoaD/ThiS family protein [archaeon]MCP8314384.1 MoaD/ThiS family protein [archaeon]